MSLRNEELQQRIAAVQIRLHTTKAAIEQKLKSREEIEIEMDKYLQQGGVVTVLRGVGSTPRPLRSVNETKRNASTYQITKIINWCNQGKTSIPRRNMLAELTGIDLYHIRTTITPGTRKTLSMIDYKKIIAVLGQVEQLEKEKRAS